MTAASASRQSACEAGTCSLFDQQPAIVNQQFLAPFPVAVHNGAMTVRRLKTYTGAQGYVYQYYFVGKRPALPDDPEGPASEFIFDVTSDRKLTYSVSVFLPQGPLAAWAQAHGRALNDAEQYAAVKLRLFRAFDELEDVKASGRRLSIDATLLEEALSSLGVE
jgi:hypothetical protein